MNKLYLIILCMLFLNFVSAFPYEILPNGTLQEVNYTLNGTQVDIILYNNSLFIVESNKTIYQNITNFNITNITYINETCINCSNYYNYTYYNNITGYNQTELGKYLTITEFNSYKSGLNYATKQEITDLNSTISQSKEAGDTIWIWVSITVLFIIELIIFFIIWRAE